MRIPALRAFALAAALTFAPSVASAQTIVAAIHVSVAPPPIRVEVTPPAPSPAHAWIAGHWVWRGQHEWMAGHWALPPEPGYAWEPARWVNSGGDWVFYEGHWRVVAPPVRVIYQPVAIPAVEVDVAPPTPIVEVRPAAPFTDALWIPGYWYWHGARHFWVGGRWSAPHPGHVWEPHHWVQVGVRWRFVVGRWR